MSKPPVTLTPARRAALIRALEAAAVEAERLLGDVREAQGKPRERPAHGRA